MRKQIIYLLGMAVAFSACTRISFMHSISDKNEEKRFKKELLGKWSESGDGSEVITGKEIFIIDSSLNEKNGLVYQVRIFGDGKKFELGDSSYLIGELFELQGKFFMMINSDFENRNLRSMGVYNMATVIPSFYVVRMFSIKEDALEIGVLNGEAFIKLIKEKKFSIKHEVIEENEEGEAEDVIVFEKSDDLKKKLLELEKFPDVYEKMTLRRIR